MPIKLTESRLRQIISEEAKRLISEGENYAVTTHPSHDTAMLPRVQKGPTARGQALLDQLRSRIGTDVTVRTSIYYYDGRGWDMIKTPTAPVYRLLDVASPGTNRPSAAATFAGSPRRAGGAVEALFMIKGKPTWVLVTSQDVELV